MEIVVARSFVARLRGLAFRRECAAALLLPRCRSVHTFGMRFGLDLVWLDAGGDVVRIDRDVPPCRVRSCRGARAVLEVPVNVNCGWVGRWREPPPCQRSSS